MSRRTLVSSALGAFVLAGSLSAQGPQQTPTPTPTPTPSATPSPSPAPATTVTGKWTMSLEMQMGTATPSLDLVQQGEKITGFYEGRYGKFPVTGTIKKNVIEFYFSMNAEGTEVVMSFKGQVAPDFKSMKGDADMGGAGEANWSAAPQKK